MGFGLVNNNDNATSKFDCYECVRRKKKRFRSNDLTEYQTHWTKFGHKGPSRPGLADIELHGWKTQGKPWEV